MLSEFYTRDVFEIILNQAHNGILLIDQSGKILLYNQACERLFQYKSEDVVGSSVSDLFPDLKLDQADLPSHYEASLMACIKGGESRLMSVSLSVVPVSAPEADESSVGFVVVRDLSGQKLAEQRLLQAQKMEAVGTITSTMAHNFNNLLAIINGSTQLLKRQLSAGQLDADKIELQLDTIESAANRGQGQISRLMLFARDDALNEEGGLARVNFETLMDDIGSLIEMSLPTVVTFSYECAPDVAPVVMDVSRFESALLNMVGNASDAMPDGGVFSIKISNVYLDESYQTLSPEIKVGPYVCFAVSDTGEGMSQNTIDHLFEPFYTTKPAGKGTGLGMSVVYGCIRDIGGYIHVYSEIGRGTTFKLYMPAALDEATAKDAEKDADAVYAEAVSDQPQKNGEQAVFQSKNKTVLIIDDNPMMRDMVEQSFQRIGFETLSAANLDECLRLLACSSLSLDLLFVDMIIDGQEQAFDIVETVFEETGRPCPVIYASGYERAYIESLCDLQDEVFMSKPFSRSDLLVMLQRFWPQDEF